MTCTQRRRAGSELFLISFGLAAVAMGVVITSVGALWLRLALQTGRLKVAHLLVNGALYLVYLVVVLP